MIYLRVICLSILSVFGLHGPAIAAPVDLNRFMQALKFDETIAILSEEGMQSGAELGQDMLLFNDDRRWRKILSEIYDADRMRRKIADGLKTGLETLDADPVMAFFESEAGAEILSLENVARRSMMVIATEEAAIESYQAQIDLQTPRLKQIETMINDSDLIERNVAGALTANLMFYRGLADGGAVELSEDEMLRDVWADEQSIRDELTEWLKAYFMLAYDPLEDEIIQNYTEFYRSDAGKQLNQILFDTFDALYEETSYLLGRAIAGYGEGSDL